MLQRIRFFFYQTLKSPSSKTEVAGGFAIGVFIGFLPIIGVHMATALFFTTFFKKNHWAALLAVWIVNPITFLPIYLFNYWVGLFFYPRGAGYHEIKVLLENFTWSSLLALGSDILIPLFVGSVVVGIVMTVLGYVLCLRFYEPLKVRFVGP